nr:PREDICTED: splicing factor U2af large subunit B-like [Tribolium castaneum]|eukprot:XP_015837616.1 PREDICTED: splicing factor U2af large subunit B-like [Tribolium castaneum]
MSKRLRKENRHSSGSDDDYEYHRRHSKTRDRSSSRDVERRHRHKQKSKGRSLGRHSSRERTSRCQRRRRSEKSDVSALSEALLKGMGQLVQAQGKTVTESHHLADIDMVRAKKTDREKLSDFPTISLFCCRLRYWSSTDAPMIIL